MHKLTSILTSVIIGTSFAVADNSDEPSAARLVFDHYITIQSALAGDSLEGVPEAATAIAKAVRADDHKTFPSKIAGQAEEIAKASDIKTARKAFKGLSESLIAQRDSDKALAQRYVKVYCPMAFSNQGAHWLQKDKTVANPYFGASMLRCGAIKK